MFQEKHDLLQLESGKAPHLISQIFVELLLEQSGYKGLSVESFVHKSPVRSYEKAISRAKDRQLLFSICFQAICFRTNSGNPNPDHLGYPPPAPTGR